MKTTVAFSIASLLILVSAADLPLRAQNPIQECPHAEHMKMMMGPMFFPMGGDWWKNPQVAQKLGLTDSQRQQLDEVLNDHRRNLLEQRTNIDRMEQQLKALLDEDPIPEDQIARQFEQLLGERDRIHRDFASMAIRTRKVLSKEQWMTLKGVAEQQMEEMHRRMHQAHSHPNSTDQ